MISETMKARLLLVLLLVTPTFLAVALPWSEPSRVDLVPAVAAYNEPVVGAASVRPAASPDRLAFHDAGHR